MSGTERRDRTNDSLDRVERHHSLDRDDGDRAPQGCPVERAAAPGVIHLVIARDDAALNRNATFLRIRFGVRPNRRTC